MKFQILTLDNAGNPHSWMNWQDAVTLKFKGLVAWEFGDEEFMFNGGISRMTGERSHIEIGSIVAIKSKFQYRNRIPPFNNVNLFRRDLNICGYCGNHFTSEFLTKDHIVPQSRGGATNFKNCVTACLKCNNKKADRTPEESGMELLYVPYVPDRAESLVLANRNILADQMKFLKEFLPKHSRLLDPKYYQI